MSNSVIFRTNPVIFRTVTDRIYRYLRWSLDYKLTYSSPDSQIVLHTDSDFAGCSDTARSQTGLALLMFGALVSWRSVRQSW